MTDSPTTNPPATAIPPGKIDLHSHVLPGIDDGCANLDESLHSIAQLQAHGYVGTVCTPHVWPEAFPHITPQNVADWVAALRRELADRDIDYHLWTGAEIRLWPGTIDWLASHDVPTLGDSRYVLTDMWNPQWDKCVDRTCDWLLERGYTPILAHPERSAKSTDLNTNFFKKLDALTARGVLLQGNLRPITGGDGSTAAHLFRHFLQNNRYTLLAVDMHRPDSLDERLLGLTLVAEEFSNDTLQQLTLTAPRQILLGTS